VATLTKNLKCQKVLSVGMLAFEKWHKI